MLSLFAAVIVGKRRTDWLIIAIAFLLCFLDDFGCAAAASSYNLDSTELPGMSVSTCGRGCRCSQNATVANCSYANLADMPTFPATTRVLVLDWNHISHLEDGLGVPPSPTSSENATLSPSRLELLSLSHNNVSKIAASALRGLMSLHRLRLDDNRIERLPAAMFADTPSVGVLLLAGNTHLDMATVGVALSTNRLPLLRVLDLSRIGTITVDGRLPEAVFSQLRALEHLLLHDVAFANMSADFFAALSGTTLKTLDLTGSSVGDVNDTAFEPLAESLQELILDRAIISRRSLDALFAGLATGSNNTELLSLSLRNVFVDDAHDQSVQPHLFRHLIHTRLKTLHLDSSYAGLHGKLPARLLHPLKHLQLLTLTGSGIRSIPSNAFHGLRHLQKLVLRHNHLSCERQSDCAFMTSQEAPLPRLRTLDLSDNLLVSGEDRDFGGGGAGVSFPADIFPTLVELDLTNNRLTTVVVGAFGTLSRLQTLRLSDNPLMDLESGALDGLAALTRLELDRCRRLTHLRAGALAGLNRLRVLSAQDSGLVHLHHAVFAHLAHLDELYLRSNQLGDQGEAIEKLVIKQSRLRVLDLGSNRLRTLPVSMFKHSPHLTAVYLDDNRLTNCSTFHVMRRCDDLEFLDISENRLTELTKQCFDSLAAGLTVKVAGNPFQCSCETADAVQWLVSDAGRRPDVADGDAVTCTGPSEMAGTHILRSGEVSRLPGAWQCRWRADAVVAVVVLLCLTLVVIVVVRLRRRFLLRRLRRAESSAGGTVQNGSISSVTISNSCYGNGSVGGVDVGAGTSASTGGEPNTRYSPLIEDDATSFSGHQPPSVDLRLRSVKGQAASFVGEDLVQRGITTGNGGLSQRKQQSASSADVETSCGDIDNEALLGCHVTEAEGSV